MSNTPNIEPKFINRAEAIILENLSNEQFGVSELAEALNMSRSNLLRKIRKQTQLSASQFIRKVRLEKSMDMLRESSFTVSDVSYKVGFGSTSYFIKCFREQYGYPPGEVRKTPVGEPAQQENVTSYLFKRYQWQIIMAVSMVVLVISLFALNKKDVVSVVAIEKSIAVLPFKNESSDTTNLYFVNGLMESALGNLQKIEDLRVISRTSVEKYRNTEKGVSEIAEELSVNYLVEGSGQRVGNKVLLNIQLIEVLSDQPIWVEQYSREVDDIFALQHEVAQKIAAAIEAVVTPAELEQIEKSPTENLVAYDYYLQGLEHHYTETKEGWEKAIPLFKQAIEDDPEFALAYANISIAYYQLDKVQNQKEYQQQINNYADKALLYDSKSDISLIAKALYYMYTEEYRLALPHLEKALEYNPNSSAVAAVLSILYGSYLPDTAKHLKYALMRAQLDIAVNDSIAKSYVYLELSNALIQTGFTDEALTYIDKSLDQNPQNTYAPYLKTLILFAKDGNMERTSKLLKMEWKKDTTRLDILKEVANFHYYQEDYTNALFYFEKFIRAKEKFDLHLYPHEDIKIGRVYEKMGFDEKAANYYKTYAAYCEMEQSIYKSASMAVKYANEGKNEKAIEQLQIFATQDNYQYWILLFLERDPLIKGLKNHPEYNSAILKIKDRFWKNKAKLEKSLVEQELI